MNTLQHLFDARDTLVRMANDYELLADDALAFSKQYRDQARQIREKAMDIDATIEWQRQAGRTRPELVKNG